MEEGCLPIGPLLVMECFLRVTAKVTWESILFVVSADKLLLCLPKMVFHFCTSFLNKAVLVSYQAAHWQVEEQCLANDAGKLGNAAIPEEQAGMWGWWS